MQKEKIYDLLQEIRPEIDFTESSDYISDGLLDSYDILELISNLMDTYQIEIDPLDIIPENFQNIDTIWQLVDQEN